MMKLFGTDNFRIHNEGTKIAIKKQYYSSECLWVDKKDLDELIYLLQKARDEFE